MSRKVRTGSAAEAVATVVVAAAKDEQFFTCPVWFAAGVPDGMANFTEALDMTMGKLRWSSSGTAFRAQHRSPLHWCDSGAMTTFASTVRAPGSWIRSVARMERTLQMGPSRVSGMARRRGVFPEIPNVRWPVHGQHWQGEFEWLAVLQQRGGQREFGWIQPG